MKSPVLRRLPLAAMIGVAFSLPALAQTSAEELKTVVVTASAQEHSLQDAPASISVITRADIEKRPVLEIAELLGTVEGVSLSRSGNLVPGVQLRGLGQAYTLFLVDGKRVNSTSVSFRGNDYDTGWVPTSEIERIEIVRGPMSSLYGSDAIGGVVNIITRKVGQKWRGSLKLDTVQPNDNEAGDTRSASVSVSGPLVADVLGLRVSAGYDKRDGDGKVNAPVNGVTQTGFPLIANRQLGAMLSWIPAAGQDVKLGYDTSRRDHGGFVLEREATSLSHNGSYDFGRSSVTLNLDETRNLIGTVTGQTNPNKANTSSLDGKLVLPWESARQVVTVGGEVRREKLHDPANITGLPGTPDYRSNPNISVNQYALFLEDEITLLDDLKLTVGNRYDHHKNFGGHNSPRAYLVYHVDQHITLKGGLARAFRAPTLLQGSQNWGSVSCGSATVGCYIVGSAALKPETSTSKELGAQFDYGKVGGGVTVFHNNLKDMIDITSRTADRVLAPTYSNFVGFLPDGRPIFAYQNIAKVRTKGLESSVRAELSSQLSVRANYTYTDAKNTSGVKELPMIYRPRHTANVALDWRPTDSWSATATARYIGEQYLSVPSNGLNLVKKSAYTVTDLSGAYNWGKTLTVSAGVLNVGDKGDQRTSSSDFNEEGRRVFLSLLTKF
ncbi:MULTISPECIES: TonB-dependent receptor domain-containing protein [unclassified Duganella]|uniref:TonB-dependent receptor domain-containing protein n=1 Tax=unclassified Duganella TaxID=2636909 RepID=UPI00088D6948|nr:MULTISPECIES: TonB-dependent receptor [unclassified Duganella]SDF64213.1 outer membrane receptor for ferrienterochelin and colicins [Duganella sp. OV458]SDI64331.1 outer membrane receptor for ferrienterochelin and colicins [Duganella sp. OV510]